MNKNDDILDDILDYIVYATFFVVFIWFIVSEAHAVDMKYCGEPPRDVNGIIIRSSKAKAEFRAEVPCPSTGLYAGACPGWSIDHVWPLDSCGCDTATNMQWLKNTIKSCAGTECKDRWERQVYKCKG